MKKSQKAAIKSQLKKGAVMLWEKHKDEVMSLLGRFAETELKTLALKLRDVPKIKKIVKRAVCAVVLCLIGGILIASGVAAWLSSVIALPAGVWSIIVGIVLMLIAWILKTA